MKIKVFLFSILAMLIFSISAFAVAPSLPTGVVSTDNYYMCKTNDGKWLLLKIDSNTGYFYTKPDGIITASSTFDWYIKPVNDEWMLARENFSAGDEVFYSTSVIATEQYGKSVYGQLEKTSFFFKALEPPLMVLREVQLGAVLKQIVGLLPLLISCLVGFLGLRKGLAMVSDLLHQA